MQFIWQTTIYFIQYQALQSYLLPLLQRLMSMALQAKESLLFASYPQEVLKSMYLFLLALQLQHVRFLWESIISKLLLRSEIVVLPHTSTIHLNCLSVMFRSYVFRLFCLKTEYSLTLLLSFEAWRFHDTGTANSSWTWSRNRSSGSSVSLLRFQGGWPRDGNGTIFLR